MRLETWLGEVTVLWSIYQDGQTFLLSTYACRKYGAAFNSLHLFRISSFIFWQSWYSTLMLTIFMWDYFVPVRLAAPTREVQEHRSSCCSHQRPGIENCGEVKFLPLVVAAFFVHWLLLYQAKFCLGQSSGLLVIIIIHFLLPTAVASVDKSEGNAHITGSLFSMFFIKLWTISSRRMIILFVRTARQAESPLSVSFKQTSMTENWELARKRYVK